MQTFDSGRRTIEEHRALCDVSRMGHTLSQFIDNLIIQNRLQTAKVLF